LSSHALAVPSALASECAGDQDRFAEYADVLYEHQDAIGQKTWDDFAILAEVPDIESFRECVVTERHRERVENDAKLARGLGLRGTPSFIVNGRLRIGAPSDSVLARWVAQAR
jgi:protein-disulfide isomerase